MTRSGGVGSQSFHIKEKSTGAHECLKGMTAITRWIGLDVWSRRAGIIGPIYPLKTFLYNAVCDRKKIGRNRNLMRRHCQALADASNFVMVAN